MCTKKKMLSLDVHTPVTFIVAMNCQIVLISFSSRITF